MSLLTRYESLTFHGTRCCLILLKCIRRKMMPYNQHQYADADDTLCSACCLQTRSTRAIHAPLSNVLGTFVFCFHCHTSDSHLFSLQMFFLGGSFTFDKNRHIVQLCLATHTPCQLLSINSTVVSRHDHFLANTV